MEGNNWIVVVLIGAVAGLLSGTLGLGGAVLIIPALTMFLGFSQLTAQGTTLMMLVMPVGALAAWQYYKGGYVEIGTALVLGVAFFISGYFGAKLAAHIPADLIRKAFALTLLLIAIKMWFFDKQ